MSSSLACFIARKISPINNPVFISHDIYHYALFARLLSRQGFIVSVPLKFPYSYSIPPYFEYERSKLPPFLSHHRQLYLNSIPCNSLNMTKVKTFMLNRVSPDNNNIFYLQSSAYSRIIKNKHLISNLNKSPYFVLYLHAFTDDLHRYGYDCFDSIWEWTLFCIDYIDIS